MEDVNIYIQAVAGISPQQTFDATGLSRILSYNIQVIALIVLNRNTMS
jgi:hypothetical protein